MLENFVLEWCSHTPLPQPLNSIWLFGIRKFNLTFSTSNIFCHTNIVFSRKYFTMDHKTYIADMSCTNTQGFIRYDKAHVHWHRIFQVRKQTFYAFGECLLHKSQCDNKHHDELNMHNSITTNKSVVKYNIIDECCIFPQYALTKMQEGKNITIYVTYTVLTCIALQYYHILLCVFLFFLLCSVDPFQNKS